MLKSISVFVFAALLLASCGNTSIRNNKNSANSELQGSSIAVEGQIARIITSDKPVNEEIKKDMGVSSACCDSASKAVAPCKDTLKAAAECETEAALAMQPALKELMMVYNKHILVK